MSVRSTVSDEESVPATARRVGGRVQIHGRAFERAIREASAETIGVPRGTVDVDVAEWGGGLAVRVAAGLPIPDLDDDEAIRRQPPIIDQMRDVQQRMAQEFARLTGREIRRVAVTAKGAVAPVRKRVR